MEIKTIEGRAALPRILFDGSDERPVDVDFVLPDYFPDVAAVLNCRLKPMIQSRQISGDRVMADGIALIQVLYLDENRQTVRSCEFSQPFTSAFTVPELTPDVAARLRVKTDYVNCRATSSRRLDVHGAFTVKLTVTAAGESELIRDVEGDGFQKRRCTLVGTVPAVAAEKAFTLNETLELEPGRPAAQTLIRGDAAAVLEECKATMSKVILKGTVYLHHLYAAEDGQMETVDHEIPFNQIVDVDGLRDDWLCDVDLQVASGDVRVVSDPAGGATRLLAAIKLNASVCCLRDEEITALSDVFSTRFAVQTQSRPLQVERLTGIHRQKETVRQTFSLPPDDIAQIVDLWADASVVSQRTEEGVCTVDGRMMIHLLTRDTAGTAAYYERPLDLPLSFRDGADRTEIALTVASVDYAVNAQKQVELTAELSVIRRCYVCRRAAVVDAVSADPQAAFAPEKAALKIYYAAAGESLWEIAKACHTSMEEVMKENDLTADTLTADTMLLVPLC
jgi:LysM repeat protein